MERNRTFIAIFLIFLVAGQITSVYADFNIPHLEVNAANTRFAAGTHGNIGITIHNGGDIDVSEVEAFLTSATPGISILSNTQKVVNTLKIDESAFYNVTVIVDQSVAVGAYALTMQLSYVRGAIGTVFATIPITIVVNEQFLPMIDFTVSPKKLVAGGSNDVMVSVANIASADLENLALSLVTSSPYLSIESPPTISVASIRAGEKTTFTVKVYTLESTPLGSYPLSAVSSYSSTTGDNYRQVAPLSLEVTAPVITTIPVLTVRNLNTTATLPGHRFTISARVDCDDAPAYNVKATFTLDATGMLRPLSPTTISLSDFKAGDSQIVSCTVLVDGAAAANQIPTTIVLSYVDSKGVQRTTTEILTVQIGQIVDFEIMNPTQVNVEQGNTGKIDSSLILKGTSRVQFTNIEVVSDSNIQTIPESSKYIGAIYPDSPVLFTLKFNAQSSAALGGTNVKIIVSYLDNLNIPRQQELSYIITIIKPTPTIGSDFWGWLRHVLGLG
jgi:hypothetical protein